MKKRLELFLLASLLTSCSIKITLNTSSQSSGSNQSTSFKDDSTSKPSQTSSSNTQDKDSSTSEKTSASSSSANESSSKPSTPPLSSSSSSSNDNPPIIVDKNEILKDTTFSSLENWTLFHDDNSQVSINSNGNKSISLKVNNKNSLEYWSVQLLQSNLSLTKDEVYSISFEVTSNVTRSIQFLLQSTVYSYTPVNRIINLNANEKHTFNTKINLEQTNTYLYGFMLGNVNGTLLDDHNITISNVSLTGEVKQEEQTEGKDGTFDEAPTTLKNRNLVWQDEFNGNSIDSSKWSYELGNSGWGNNEYQYYTDRKENAYCSNGSLKIVARKENYSGSSYTSSRIISKDKYEFTYGYVETRIALPSMSGIWPAFWLLGANIDEQQWPYCGEIDVMEAINDEEKVYSTLHWNNGSFGSSYSHAEYGNKGVSINNRTEYHIYGFEWTSTAIKTYLDNNLVYSMNISGNNGIEAFRKDFYFLFNVAVGGNWPGFNIGNDFPQTMSVDYIRVYQ